MQNGQKKVYAGVSPEAFIEAWQAGESPAAVARALGMTKAGVAARATGYRAQGVPLKKFHGLGGGRPPMDWSALARLAKKCAR